MSNNLYELSTSVGSILKIHDDIYKIFAGHNDKRYLLDISKDIIIEEYDNETLLNEDIMRRLCKK